jgi:hypothetical protein
MVCREIYYGARLAAMAGRRAGDMNVVTSTNTVGLLYINAPLTL